MALLAAFIAYCAYASIMTLFPGGQQPLLQGEITAERLPDALKALPPAELQALLAREQARLAAEPLDRTALINLAMLHRAQGDGPRADALTIVAASRAARDSRAQALALPIHLAKGEAPGALTRLDALLRARPEAQEQLFSALLVLAGNKSAEVLVADLLARDPPWRIPFLQWAALKSPQPQIAYQLLSALKASRLPPRAAEVRAVINHYAAAKDYATAYFIWLDLLSEVEVRKAGNIHDGGFDLPIESLNFGWNLNNPKNAETKVVPRANGSADNVLRIDFINNRDLVAPVFQTIRLAPGRYVFSGDYKAEDLKTDSGLVWRVHCLEGKSGLIHFSTPLSGNRQWDHFETRFDVPQDCATQQLYLVMRSDAALDQIVSGRAYYDNLAIQPAEKQ
jgi:hypothetical protein